MRVRCVWCGWVVYKPIKVKTSNPQLLDPGDPKGVKKEIVMCEGCYKVWSESGDL